jgi:peptidyl-prolyl cis-trans isomerase C
VIICSFCLGWFRININISLHNEAIQDIVISDIYLMRARKSIMKQLLTLFLIILSTQSAFAIQNSDKIVAKVNGKEIHESQIRDKVQKFAEFNGIDSGQEFNYDNLEPNMKNEIIKNIVIGDLIIDDAKRAKINQSQEYKQAIMFAENQLMQKLYLEKVVAESVTEKAINDEYNVIKQEFSNVDEYKVKHILVKTEAEAKEIEKKLAKGEDFAKLAKEFSLDSTKDSGGELGYFSNGQMTEPFELATAKLKIGEISSPVETDFGYHIIKLEDKRKAKAPSLDDLRNQITDSLTGKVIQEYIDNLKNKNKIEFLD